VSEAPDYAFPHSAEDESRRLQLLEQRLDPLTKRRIQRLGVGNAVGVDPMIRSTCDNQDLTPTVRHTHENPADAAAPLSSRHIAVEHPPSIAAAPSGSATGYAAPSANL
jgi:hypothetical protein